LGLRVRAAAAPVEGTVQIDEPTSLRRCGEKVLELAS
jgi:hypothetical protein